MSTSDPLTAPLADGSSPQSPAAAKEPPSLPSATHPPPPPSRLPRSASSPFVNFEPQSELKAHFVMRALRALQKQGADEKQAEFLSLLTTGKAALFLPIASSLVHVAEKISSLFFEHHVFVRNPDNEMQFLSLGGIRALVKGQRLIIIGDRPTDRELNGKKSSDGLLSIWDTINVQTTSADQYPSIELLSDTAMDVPLNDPATTIKVHLLRRAIMQEDITGSLIAAHPRTSSNPPLPPPRAPPSYNTSLLSLPSLSFDLASMPAHVLTQIGAIPSLFTAKTLPQTVAPLLDVPALAQDPAYLAFMAQMRDPRCAPFVAEITRYLAALTESSVPVSSDKIAAYHNAFIHRIQMLFKENGAVFQGVEAGHVARVLHGLEEYLLARGYPTYFVAVLNEEQLSDLAIHRKISLLATIDFGLEELGFPPVVSPEALKKTVKLAGVALLKAERSPTPRSKLAHLITCHRVVTERMHMLLDEETISASSADALLPLLIYVVVKSNPPRLTSTLKYIRAFLAADLSGCGDGGKDEENGIASYCVTNMSAVLSFLETLDTTNLDVGDAELEDAYSLNPSNAGGEEVIVMPTNHSILLLDGAEQAEHYRRSKSKPPDSLTKATGAAMANLPPLQLAQNVRAGGAAVVDSIGKGISGLWPFRAAVPLPPPPLVPPRAQELAATSPPPDSAPPTPRTPDRLWSRLKNHAGA
ncbi:hypothetical protein BDZ88DRAFT_424933 [Geranomyces variabilis]|nr:hypothetical protein BDZ88DRAFT_424933 [Geranomyces variabilis]KAJ3141189.1 hypothetical protein HDU90_007215 [Geranomyces variabilis]